MSKNKELVTVLEMKLQGLYDMENQIIEALPELEKAASNPKLKKGLQMHLEETENHAVRIEKAFDLLDVKPETLLHQGIRGIIEDGSVMLDMGMSSELMDTIIACNDSCC